MGCQPRLGWEVEEDVTQLLESQNELLMNEELITTEQEHEAL